MNGWYKQTRNVFERVWAKDPKMVSVYLYLHCHAYVQDGMLPSGRLVRRGSCPTSNAAIMEGTGLSEHDVKSRIEKLKNYGEIIVNSSNLGKIITICDYDTCNDTEDLFGLNSSNELPTKLPTQLPNESPSELPTKLPPYIEYKNKDNNNLISFSYKNEREKWDSLALEIKSRYNKRFAGKLQPCIRLSMPVKFALWDCLRKFGKQSVDMVFDQVEAEPFSMGQNKTGFQASFQFIFQPKNFQGYLERYQLRLQRKPHPTQEKPAEAKQTKKKEPETIDMYEAKSNLMTSSERKQNLLDMIEYIKSNPRSLSCEMLEEAYKSGELARYGIDWKPNNI